MQLKSPHLDAPTAATEEIIVSLIPELVAKADPFAILSLDEQTYMQVLWTKTGFVLDYQEGSSIEQHYRSVRTDLSYSEITEAFVAYLRSGGSSKPEIEFRRVHLAPLSSRIGYFLGRFFGAVKRGYSEARDSSSS